MNFDTVRKGKYYVQKDTTQAMTLYGISSRDSNNDNIYELRAKHVNLSRHQIPQITHISNEATTFGKRNNFEIWNVT